MPKLGVFILLLALACPAVAVGQEEPQLSMPPTLEEVQRACAQFPSWRVVDAMLNLEPRWGRLDYAFGMVSEGDQAWLDIFVDCLSHAPLDASTWYKYQTLALALPNNPVGVLKALGDEYYRHNLGDVCSLDFFEPKYTWLMDLGQRSLDALATVDDPTLAERRDLCARELREAMESVQSLYKRGLWTNY